MHYTLTYLKNAITFLKLTLFFLFSCDKNTEETISTKKSNKKRIKVTVNNILNCPFLSHDVGDCVLYHKDMDCYDYIKYGKCFDHSKCTKRHTMESLEYHTDLYRLLEKLRIQDDLDHTSTLKLIFFLEISQNYERVSKLEKENANFKRVLYNIKEHIKNDVALEAT